MNPVDRFLADLLDDPNASAGLSADQVQEVAHIIGAQNHEALGAMLKEILSGYEWNRWGGRDTLPTVTEAHKTCIEIEQRLTWILKALIGRDKSPALVAWLSSAMAGEEIGAVEYGVCPSDFPKEFTDTVLRLWDAVRKVNADFERDPKTPFEVNGDLHHRKTRTDARDTVLIPALILCAQIHGDPDLVGNEEDYEVLDTICEFLTACMFAARIPAPDAGDTMRGESKQGRLRRLVKKACAKFPGIRAVDK